MPERLTPERLEWIGHQVTQFGSVWTPREAMAFGAEAIPALIAEIDAVTAERDDAEGRASAHERMADELRGSLAAVLRIVSDWCAEANSTGGLDAGDLAWRLEQAGYPLPDTTTPTTEGD